MAILASVRNSERAVGLSILVVRAFAGLRDLLVNQMYATGRGPESDDVKAVSADQLPE